MSNEAESVKSRRSWAPLAVILLGYGVLVSGVAMLSTPAALIVAGVLAIVGGVDLARPDPPQAS